MRKLLAAVMGATLMAGAGVLTVPASAGPGPLTCTGTNSGTYSSVTVPNGNTCNLQNATVTGSVTVQPGGRLISGDGNTIKGSVNSTNAGKDTTSDPLGLDGSRFDFSIIICNTHIKGSVSVSGATSEVAIGDDEACGGNAIDGSVNLIGNLVGPELVSNENTVDECPIAQTSSLNTPCGIGGAVTVNSNHGTTHDDSQSAEVGSNTIVGALNCAGNANGVTPEGTNKAASKNGQCRASLGF